MRSFLLAALGMVLGCSPAATPPATSTTGAPTSAPTPESTAPPNAPELGTPPKTDAPALAIQKLAATVKPDGAGRVVNLTFDLARASELPAGTILFVHTVCKVGYNKKSEDNRVAGVETIPTDTPRASRVVAYTVAPLSSDPEWCTISFGYGDKTTKNESPLTEHCLKKGALTDGPCPTS